LQFIGYQMINVVCVLRQGGKVGYDSTWVEKLKNSVNRNLTLPHRFICLSDCEVECDRIPLIAGGRGFWSKIEMFRPNLFNGPVLYIDLDNVICSSLDKIVEKIKDEKFVMLKEYDTGVSSSSIMWWNGDYSFLWDKWISESPDHWKKIYAKMPKFGDQAFIEDHVKYTHLQDYILDEWIGWANKSIQSHETKILVFRKPGQKPSTMPDHPLVKKHWV
jgi:hypothetical protein